MKIRMKILTGLTLCLILLAAACAPQPAQPVEPTPEPRPSQPDAAPDAGEVVLISDIPRESAPQVSEQDSREFVAGNTAFALDLYRQLRLKEEGNLFYSPYSITLALAMTYAGARGQTESEMAETLHFNLNQEDLHRAFNALDQQLRMAAQNGEEAAFRLNIANSLWGQQDYPFRQAFLETLARNYGAGMNIVDYRQPEQARELINAWVADQTEDKILDLIPPGTLSELTRLVLANAIYFNAAWVNPFDEGATSPDDFTLLDGQVIQAPMMRLSNILAYGKWENFQAVELPYYPGTMSMLVVVPDEGEFEAFEQGLNASRLEEILAGLQRTQVELSMPRFKIESAFSLSDALKGMGMPEAFDPDRADFTGMTEERELFITEVIHKAYVDVNEEGTEAAAATGVVIGVTSMPADQVTLDIDRPFVFMIVDRLSGTILFVGSVVDPS